MDKRVVVSRIEIISAGETGLLSKKQIEKFCREKVRIRIKENVGSAHDICKKSCRVVLNVMSAEFIRNDLNGNHTVSEKQHKVEKTLKVNRTFFLIHVFLFTTYVDLNRNIVIHLMSNTFLFINYRRIIPLRVTARRICDWL